MTGPAPDIPTHPTTPTKGSAMHIATIRESTLTSEHCASVSGVQSWHRPHDHFQQPAEVLDRMSPRLRRMFGDFGDEAHPTDYYKPVDQGDVMAVGGNHGGE